MALRNVNFPSVAQQFAMQCINSQDIVKIVPWYSGFSSRKFNILEYKNDMAKENEAYNMMKRNTHISKLKHT